MAGLRNTISLCHLHQFNGWTLKQDTKMAISVNSVVGFNSTLPAKYPHVSRSSFGALAPKATQFTSSLVMFGSRIWIRERRRGLYLSVADSDNLATDTSDKGPGVAESSIPDNQLSTVNPSSVDSQRGNNEFETGIDDGSKTSGASNGSTSSSYLKQDRPNLQSTTRRSPLTARDRLRAARVLSRYTESKVSKSEMGSKVLDALRESDRGKRSGLPEAPTNLFDDSKRGLPKQGWTFQFPGGADLFVIVFSFVFISTVMFATTYIVWKAGAIHFNEY